MGISTHVLDTALGRPAADVPVSLSRRLGERWELLSESRTDADGRGRQLLPEGTELDAGLYRVRFDTAAYFEAQEIADEQQHYHIPLLLTANGYTTYRGS
jgi:5-hydroxyisourate hydrolase